MAENVQATRLAGLQQYAGEVFSGSQGKYTLDDYDYTDDTSLFSTAMFTVANNGLQAGAANSINLFSTSYGNVGQGFAVPLSTAETNLQPGQANMFPTNQAYAGIAGGFDVYCIPADNQGAPNQQGGISVPNAADLTQILGSCVWKWNQGGNQSPLVLYEPIKAWPCGFGAYGIGAVGSVQAASNGGPVSSMRKFSYPLTFPPLTAVQLNIAFVRNVTDLISLPNGSKVLIAMHLRGYMLSKVR